MRNFSRLVKPIVQMIVVTISLLLLLNVIALLFLKLEDVRAARRQQNGWLTEYYREADGLRVRWMPYSYWICERFKGKYINVHADGLRHTWHNGITSASSTGERMFRVFMFGGSTMFGWAASDNYTIPSALVKALAQRGIDGVEITNFGQPGYVSTQEMILLLMQLKERNVPDLVIFYDGCNDTFSAFQNGKAGITENEGNRAREFNFLNTHLPEARRQLYGFTAKTFVSHLAIVRMTIFCLRKLVPGISLEDSDVDDGGVWTWQRFAHGAGPKQLPQSTVQTYLDNVQLIAEVGGRMGFSSMFYWQPTLFSKAGVSPAEARLIHIEPQLRNMRPFFQEVNHYVHSAAGTGPHKGNRLKFLDDALPPKMSCYIDFMHVTGDCNEIIARRIADDVALVINDTRRVNK
jgi:hypothetical protein